MLKLIIPYIKYLFIFGGDGEKYLFIYYPLSEIYKVDLYQIKVFKTFLITSTSTNIGYIIYIYKVSFVGYVYFSDKLTIPYLQVRHRIRYLLELDQDSSIHTTIPVVQKLINRYTDSMIWIFFTDRETREL